MTENRWVLILGGSSGMGLASAKKLATDGYNIFIVHRDRRGSMAKIEPEFETIRTSGVKFETMNVNALSEEGRHSVVGQLKEVLCGGKVHVLLHSIALGNLKLLAPIPEQKHSAVSDLAEKLSIPADKLQNEIDQMFNDGVYQLVGLAEKPEYNNDLFTGEEDMSQTIYNMGTSLLSWVQDIFSAKLFAEDSRVLGLTSEGNEIAWRGYAAVSAAKCALESVSRAIALEFGPYGIKSNILQPGITDTPALRLIPGSQHMKAHAIQRNPLGRITLPEDVANVVSLLSRPEAAWINGTIIRVDGGEHISG